MTRDTVIIFGYKFDSEEELLDTIKNTLINTDNIIFSDNK